MEYAIVAVCDQDCLDIDLEITSAADSIPGKIRDVSPDDWPGLKFTAPKTGQYDLTLTMFTCRARTCAWGGQLFRRESGSSER